MSRSKLYAVLILVPFVLMVAMIDGAAAEKLNRHGTSVTTNSESMEVGDYEGVRGKGTWNSYSLAPQMSYLEIEGEVDMPK